MPSVSARPAPDPRTSGSVAAHPSSAAPGGRASPTWTLDRSTGADSKAPTIRPSRSATSSPISSLTRSARISARSSSGSSAAKPRAKTGACCLMVAEERRQGDQSVDVAWLGAPHAVGPGDVRDLPDAVRVLLPEREARPGLDQRRIARWDERVVPRHGPRRTSATRRRRRDREDLRPPRQRGRRARPRRSGPRSRRRGGSRAGSRRRGRRAARRRPTRSSSRGQRLHLGGCAAAGSSYRAGARARSPRCARCRRARRRPAASTNSAENG